MTGGARIRNSHVAAAIDFQAFEAVEIDFDLQSPIADGGQRLLHIGGRKAAEVGALQQPIKLAEEFLEPGEAIALVEIVQCLRVGVGIEWGVSILQCVQMRVIFKMQRGVEQSTELAERRGLECRNVGLPTQLVDQFRFANRNEMLQTRRRRFFKRRRTACAGHFQNG